MIYKMLPKTGDMQIFAKFDDDGICRLTCTSQNLQFRSDILNQEPGGAVVADGDSFSLNTSPNDSILEDADGNVMTIDEAKAYVRTLP
jgi:hypothetical protein